MKKVFLMTFLILGIISIATAENKQLGKARAKQAKEKMKFFKKESWVVDGTSRTLEVALLEHYEKLKSEDYQEMVGEVSSCISKNVCRQTAFNNVAIDYANKASSFVKGRVLSDNNINQSSADGKEEFDKAYSAYERLIQAELKGVIQESYAVTRKNGTGPTKEYHVYYLVNETKASQARMKAMENALKETKIAQEYATKISDFVKEGFKVEKE